LAWFVSLFWRAFGGLAWDYIILFIRKKCKLYSCKRINKRELSITSGVTGLILLIPRFVFIFYNIGVGIVSVVTVAGIVWLRIIIKDIRLVSLFFPRILRLI